MKTRQLLAIVVLGALCVDAVAQKCYVINHPNRFNGSRTSTLYEINPSNGQNIQTIGAIAHIEYSDIRHPAPDRNLRPRHLDRQRRTRRIVDIDYRRPALW